MSVGLAIDRDQLRARCLDDREFMRQMLGVFREFAPQTVEQLRTSIENQAWTDAKRHAHTLKGSAANLAAGPLQAAAAKAEAALSNDDANALPPILGEIDQAMQACLNAIDTLLVELSRS